MKRHASLTLLSRDHHKVLLMAHQVRQGKLGESRSHWEGDRELQRDQILDYFDTQLRYHFEAEEEVLFPLAEQHLPQKEQITSLLRKQHHQVRNLVSELRTVKGVQLENLLLRMAHVLEEHIRKEERVFFKQIEERIPKESLARCGEQIESYLQASEKNTVG